MKISRHALVFGVVAAVVLIAVAVWAIAKGRVEAGAEAANERPVAVPQRVFTEDGQRILKIDAATLERSGIVTAPLAASNTAGSNPIFAAVVDTTRLTDLANAWAVGRAQVVAARARVRASRASYERTRLLYADAQNASLAQLQAAQAAYAADQAGAAAAETQANSALSSARQEFGSSLIPGSPLVAALVDRRELLLQVAMPPEAGVAPRTLSVEGDGGVRAIARLVGAAARADPRVSGRGVYYVVAAASGLVPGTNVIARLPMAGGSSGALVPASAVVSWQGKSWIYRRSPTGSFVRVEIATSRRDAGGNIIVDNLAAGTPVVIQGPQLLLSEELRDQAPAESDGD